MASFRWILSLPRAFPFIQAKIINPSYSSLGEKNSISRLILTQSRCLFIKKSIEDTEKEDEVKRKPDLFQLNSTQKKNSINSVNKSPVRYTYFTLSDLIKKLENAPLDNTSLKFHLFEMVKVYKLQRFSPDFSKEMESFIKSEVFEKFAQSLEKSLPMGSAKYLHLVFEAMHTYEIPSSSILMQKLHALILDNINMFELPEILKMYLFIEKKNENLLEPLKNAFSAYMNHLTVDSLKLSGDIKNIAYFVSREELPLSVREKIVKKILSLGFQLKDLDAFVLTWLSYPLCSEEFKSLDKHHFLNALKETISKFEYKNLKIVLENISNGVRKNLISYDETLFDLIAQCACNYELPTASIIMSILLRFGHLNYQLANAIADKLIKTSETSLKSLRMEEIISNFASVDYKNYLMKESPEKWFKLEEVLRGYIESNVTFQYLQTFVSLCILELDSKELIGNALNNLAKVLESNEKVTISLKNGYLLHQCHCAIYSNPPENVSEKILSNYLSEIKSLSPIWKEAMYKTFNGEEYVLENCKTPFGTIISFAVIMGPDQNPINLSSYKKPKSQETKSFDNFVEIEKIERPPESKVFAFMDCSQELIKFRNSTLLRPRQRLINSIHRKLGYRIFHFYSSRKITESGDCARILCNIMARELNYITYKNSQSSTSDTSSVV